MLFLNIKFILVFYFADLVIVTSLEVTMDTSSESIGIGSKNLCK